jgi:hypothetical protein
VLAGLLAMTAAPAWAARVRYHFVPGDGPNAACLKPDCAGSETVTAFGSSGGPAPRRPNTQATFTHPYTGRPVTVPLALPPDTPRIEHRFNRVIYNYGSYTVEVVFLTDGTVDVVYNSGLFRAP